MHGGHVGKDDDPERGARQLAQDVRAARAPPLPILIENTAGGDNAMARRLDAIARLWDAEPGRRVRRSGFCLDTCHAHAGGEELADVVDRVKAITGRIDLVHANDSPRRASTPAPTGTPTSAAATIDPDDLLAVVAAAGAPVVVETPGGAEGQGADIAFLRERLPA